jgi:hypothetical protein
MTEYVTKRSITIPRGTVLHRAANQRGANGYRECVVAFGPEFSGTLLVQVHEDALASGFFKERQP